MRRCFDESRIKFRRAVCYALADTMEGEGVSNLQEPSTNYDSPAQHYLKINVPSTG
jgi:hypothetical protein